VRRADRVFVKVPKVALSFWVVKVLTTAMGEATSDFFIHRIGVTHKVALAGVAALTGLVLLVAVVLQLRSRRYDAWLYWTTVVMVAVFGTMAADGVHVGLNVPYEVSSVVFAVALAVIFWMWQASEGTLSIHSIYTHRRELFYWAVVLATFALGTAVGDLTALSFHLGYLASGVGFAVLIAIPAVGYRWFGLNEVFAFWFAYILTRPLGASFADWFAFPKESGGLGLGHGVVAVALTVVIVGFVLSLSVTKRDVPDELSPGPEGEPAHRMRPAVGASPIPRSPSD
jgi:uncharacterized membrane-anchored protein